MENMKQEIILYHGSPNKEIVPTYGLGNDKHDYGKGFYLTESPALASEWSVCNPVEKNGWVHKFMLDTRELKIFDFEKYDILSWLAELMKHRDADTVLSGKLNDAPSGRLFRADFRTLQMCQSL